MILDDILENKILEVTEAKTAVPFKVLEEKAENTPAPKDFKEALSSLQGEVRVIAEIKQASPSKGILSTDFDPVRIAKNYLQAGANAISVLTDKKFFKGSLDDLRKVRATVDLPLLRKDFMIDPYQIYEARCSGADAILLIVAALSADQLTELKSVAGTLGLHTLVEVHNVKELRTALDLKSEIIGINNRDLKTFSVDLQTSVNLKKLIPEDILTISESGIHSIDDIRLLQAQGINSFLIGESFMKAENPVQKIKEIKQSV